MKKKFLLSAVLVAICIIAFFQINISAASYTYGDLTYSVSNGEIKITDCKTSASGSLSIPATIDGYSVTGIGENAFIGCSSLTSITLPQGVTSIGEAAFCACSALTSITIPESVISISKNAFANCSALTSITLPSKITAIKESTFNGCSNLTNITIPDSVTGIGSSAFAHCSSLTSITIPRGVTYIGYGAFSSCSSLTSITVHHGVTQITHCAFKDCQQLTRIYYNGTDENWSKILINTDNDSLINAERILFQYVKIVDENGKESTEKMYVENGNVKVVDMEEKPEHTIHFYTDAEYKNEYIPTTPIEENLTLYFRYVINHYPVKFIDYNGNVISENMLAFGSVITPPENPVRKNTQEYTYSFIGWDGFTEGMTQINREMVFTALYSQTINQYTYKFVDENGDVLKEKTADYGTVITAPEISDKTEYYLFDYWQGFTPNMALTDNVTFTAVYKYKKYSITAEGLTNKITVAYNSNFVIPPQSSEGYSFIGYFTEKDGNGTQITNGKGESLSVYNTVDNLKVYPYLKSKFINKANLKGTLSAFPGDTIIQSVIFATDKNAMYFTATVKYPKYLIFNNISSVNFIEISVDDEKTIGEHKYLNLTCLYGYDGNFLEKNKNYTPFEIEFSIVKDAPIGNAQISLENVILDGDISYNITDVNNHTLTILPKLAEKIVIEGKSEIYAPAKFSAVISPDYTTNKSVVWSINDDSVATISQDGTVTPVKNGTVTITATTTDGSNISATKEINVIAYSKIDSITLSDGAVMGTLNPYVNEYTVYVKENVNLISITPTFLGGVLRLNGNGVWISGRSKEIELTDTETIITLNRENVTDMEDNIYTLKIVKTSAKDTFVSEDGSSFVIGSNNLSVGNRVYLALYNNENMVDAHTMVYNGDIVAFFTYETYNKAKVFVWENSTLNPVSEVNFLD